MPDWIFYQDPGRNFQALLPSLPKMESREIQTEIGFIKQQSFSNYDSLNPNHAYQILIASYPKQFIDSNTENEKQLIVIKTSIDEILTLLKGELVYNEMGKLNGEPCEWYLIKFKENALKACMFWNDHTFYQLLFYSGYTSSVQQDSKLFFDHFKLIK